MSPQEYYDQAEKLALEEPIEVWRFCAYASDEDYKQGKYFFKQDFLNHLEMKVFSSNFSFEYKREGEYPDLVTMYWKYRFYPKLENERISHENY